VSRYQLKAKASGHISITLKGASIQGEIGSRLHARGSYKGARESMEASPRDENNAVRVVDLHLRAPTA
jgi:hypothetical protein